MQVYYKVGDTISGDYSSLLSFTIPRETMNQFRPFTFAIFGDMDINSDSSDTVTLMEKTIDEYDLFIHMGDIAYTSLSTHIAVNASRLDDFFTYIQPIASQVPYLVSPGNQEMYYRFYEYENRWSTPVKTGQNKNLWYSFDFAGVHFVSISTEHDMDPSSEQYAWLESDLSTANSAAARATSPWIFVYGHRPIYCSNTPLNAGYFEDCYVVGVALRENLEPLLRKYNVDMYFSGHMHDAEVFHIPCFVSPSVLFPSHLLPPLSAPSFVILHRSLLPALLCLLASPLLSASFLLLCVHCTIPSPIPQLAFSLSPSKSQILIPHPPGHLSIEKWQSLAKELGESPRQLHYPSDLG
tara:strand:+ start:1243 stop:2301 length:1059 start_codon:yes stop_codon:yes gene_type:complete